MNTLTRPVTAVAGALVLLGGALAGCSDQGEEEVVFSTSTPSKASKDDNDGKDDTEKAADTVEAAAKKSEPECSVAALNRAFSLSGEGYIFLEDCEGDFAYVGKEQSDHLFLAQWTGDEWVAVEGDGVKKTGLSSVCFNESTLDELGVGPRVKANLWNCATEDKFGSQSSSSGDSDSGDGFIRSVSWETGEKFTASSPACDGRNILILRSVIDTGNHNQAKSELAFAMAYDGGHRQAEFTVPGQCSSLRANAEGGQVYPVYLDFGSDLAGMCRAKAELGGNGRVLDNSGEYIDPCL